MITCLPGTITDLFVGGYDAGSPSLRMRRAQIIIIVIGVIILAVFLVLIARLIYNERIKPLEFPDIYEGLERVEPIDIDMKKMCYELDGMYINNKCIFPHTAHFGCALAKAFLVICQVELLRIPPSRSG